MFNRTRWRLALWNAIAFGLVLTVVGAGIYLFLSRSLMNEVDRNLDSRGAEVASNYRELAEGDVGLGPPGYRGSVFYLVVDAKGAVLANPQQVDITNLQPNTASAEAYFSTIRVDGELTRVSLRPLLNARPSPLWLAVGQSLVPEFQDVVRLRIFLLIGGAVGLGLSLAAAWFLSGRAIEPIRLAYRRQQEFAADASHELRTPLAVLRSSTDMLARHEDEPLSANAGLLQDVRQEIERMEKLVDDLLTLARSDLDQLPLAVGNVDVIVLAREVVDRMRPIAQERGVNLAFEGSEEPLAVLADPDRLEQAAVILLDNAFKYVGEGGTVTVSARRQDSDALLEVADNGRGIAPEHLQHVFERFYRESHTGSSNGTGLGLAIAKSLVDAHSGKISITSTPGKGTVASIRLPALKPSISKAAAASEE